MNLMSPSPPLFACALPGALRDPLVGFAVPPGRKTQEGSGKHRVSRRQGTVGTHRDGMGDL